MKKGQKIPKTVDEYIAARPKDVQAILKKVRATIRKAAPDAEEKISYRMPAYAQKGVLLYFAAQQKHLGFYPTSKGITAFTKELSSYVTGKGSVQFPHDRPVPYGLIERIVKFRVKQNLERARAKGGKK
jgi:uncharacterized protein YdhG (YjbR/CyaY superfamily)